METSSDTTEYSMKNTVSDYREEKSATSPGSSYLSWIESVNSEYFGSAISGVPVQDVDNKVGEWNNFWLNYSNSRLRHLSTEHTFSSDGGDRSADETSEEKKSRASTQRDVSDKNSAEGGGIMLTMAEVQEAMRCSQRITEILKNAMNRSELDHSSNESYYSQTISTKNSVKEDPLTRERSVSCIDPQPLQNQKELLRSGQQSSSTSCINTLLTNGVADILKRVISKRRDVIGSESESSTSATRSSFSEWSVR